LRFLVSVFTRKVAWGLKEYLSAAGRPDSPANDKDLTAATAGTCVGGDGVTSLCVCALRPL
jgi:hypothetical protein